MIPLDSLIVDASSSPCEPEPSLSPSVFDSETPVSVSGKIESSPDDNLIESEVFEDDPNIRQIKGEIADCQSKLSKENATLEEIKITISSYRESMGSMDSKINRLLENGDTTGLRSVLSQKSSLEAEYVNLVNQKDDLLNRKIELSKDLSGKKFILDTLLKDLRAKEKIPNPKFVDSIFFSNVFFPLTFFL